MQHFFTLFLLCSSSIITAQPIGKSRTYGSAADQVDSATALLQKRSPTFGMFSSMGGGMPGLGGMMGGFPGLGSMMGGLGGGAGGSGTGSDDGTGTTTTTTSAGAGGDGRAALMAMFAKYMKGTNSGGGTTLPAVPDTKTTGKTTVPKPDPAAGPMRKRQAVAFPVAVPQTQTVGTPSQVGAGGLVTSVGTGLGMLLPGPLGAGLQSLLGGVGKEIASGLPPPGLRPRPTALPVFPAGVSPGVVPS